LPKKIQQKFSQPYSVPLMIYFARRTLKDKNNPPLYCIILLPSRGL